MPTQQILQIRPESELVFKGPYDKVVTSGLKLKNPTQNVVAFKVKTTAPKRYCVRPNSGLVQPNSEVEVSVMLQPFEYDPADKSARHKFMVQSLVVATNAVDSLDELWKSATADSLMDSKLKVVLDPGADDPPPPQAAGSSVLQSQPAASQPAAAASGGGPTPAAAAPSTAAAAPITAPSTPPTPVAGGASQVVESPIGVINKPQQQQQQLHQSSPLIQRKPVQPEYSSAPQSQLPSGESSVRNLQSEIQRLKDENARLSEQELRLRKLAMRDTKSSDPASSTTAHSGASQQMMQQQHQAPPSMPPVLFLVLALVLGLIVGKFIL